MKKIILLFGLLFLLPLVLASCPSGTDKPYCSSLDPHGYYQCKDGILSSATFYHYPCSPGEICSNGKCVLAPCPSGTTAPYCSNKDIKGYYQCKDGRFYHFSCPNVGDICSDGKCVDICNLNNINGPYCTESDPIAVFSCSSSTGPIREQCNKNIFGVQFVCKNGQCTAPDSGVFPVNKTDLETCADCDAYALSYFLGSFWKSKTCDAKGFTLGWDFLPQGTTKCMLSFIKLLLTPIAFIFTLLFSLEYLVRFKDLRGKNKKLIRLILAGFIGAIMGYLIYMYFWFGVLAFGIIVAIKSGIKSILPFK